MKLTIARSFSLALSASGASGILYRGLPEKLTSKDRGAGSISPEGT